MFSELFENGPMLVLYSHVNRKVYVQNSKLLQFFINSIGAMLLISIIKTTNIIIKIKKIIPDLKINKEIIKYI